jgi:hypothetical protein
VCLGEKEQASDSDVDLLANAIRKAGTVIVSYRFGPSLGLSAEALNEIQGSKIRFITNPWGTVRDYEIGRVQGVECASARLLQSAAGSGFSSIGPDRGGNGWRIPLVVRAGENFYQSFDVAIVAQYLKSGKVVLRLSGQTALGVELDGLFIQTDAKGNLRLRDLPETVRPADYSAREILSGYTSPAVFRGKAVIIEEAHGPETHAVAVGDILSNRYLKESRASCIVVIVLIVALPLALSLIGARLRMLSLAVPTLCALGMVWGIALCLLQSRSELVSIVYPSLSAMLAWIILPLTRSGARAATAAPRP